MAKMKIEVLAARAAKHGLSLRDRLVGYLPHYVALPHVFAPLANWRKRQPMAAQAVRKICRHQRSAHPCPPSAVTYSSRTLQPWGLPMAAKS